MRTGAAYCGRLARVGTVRTEDMLHDVTALLLVTCGLLTMRDIRAARWVERHPTRTLTLLQSTGHYMYHQFNIQQLYVLPTQCIYVFCVDLRTNSDYFLIQFKEVGEGGRGGQGGRGKQGVQREL